MKFFKRLALIFIAFFFIGVAFGYFTQCKNIAIYHPIWKGCEINFAGGSR